MKNADFFFYYLSEVKLDARLSLKGFYRHTNLKGSCKPVRCDVVLGFTYRLFAWPHDTSFRQSSAAIAQLLGWNPRHLLYRFCLSLISLSWLFCLVVWQYSCSCHQRANQQLNQETCEPIMLFHCCMWTAEVHYSFKRHNHSLKIKLGVQLHTAVDRATRHF